MTLEINPLLIYFDLFLHKPTSTLIPFDLSALTPLPFTTGFGSNIDTTTFLIPESIIAFEHGPVLP